MPFHLFSSVGALTQPATALQNSDLMPAYQMECLKMKSKCRTFRFAESTPAATGVGAARRNCPIVSCMTVANRAKLLIEPPKWLILKDNWLLLLAHDKDGFYENADKMPQ
jgi:hypothetical protein